MQPYPTDEELDRSTTKCAIETIRTESIERVSFIAQEQVWLSQIILSDARGAIAKANRACVSEKHGQPE